MARTFKLSITLGNEAMQDAADVSRALREISDKLAEGWDFSSRSMPGTVWGIRDANGNRVGDWKVTRR